LNISAIKARTSSLSKMFPSCPWMKYLKCFINCCIQRSNTLMRFLCAFRLLQMIAFTCSEHFVALKSCHSLSGARVRRDLKETCELIKSLIHSRSLNRKS
jgi:hypothetical protein